MEKEKNAQEPSSSKLHMVDVGHGEEVRKRAFMNIPVEIREALISAGWKHKDRIWMLFEGGRLLVFHTFEDYLEYKGRSEIGESATSAHPETPTQGT